MTFAIVVSPVRKDSAGLPAKPPPPKKLLPENHIDRREKSGIPFSVNWK